MKPREFVETARKVLDGESWGRERAADEVTDRLSAYSPAQASALATLLSAAATFEMENSALESELHAILELMSTGHISLDHISQLREIRVENLPPELHEFVTDLLED
jgi:hypothetical protein